MKKRAKPVLLAMIVCDKIIREEGTKKNSLIGVFDRVHATQFPCTHSRMHVYIAVTEYKGRAACELKFSDNTDKELVKMAGPLNFPDKLSVVEMDFCINNILLPDAGIYHFDFFVNGEHIGHRKFKVGRIKVGQ